jgi:hypothetical protein
VGNDKTSDSIGNSLIFIFIYPDTFSEPTKICFAQYIYDDFKLKRVDDSKYYAKVFVENTSGQVKIEK